MEMNYVDILGIPITRTDHQSMKRRLISHIEQDEKAFVVTANPEIVMEARKDARYMNSILTATYVTADGIGIVKASRILNNPLPERVTGYDLMIDFLRTSQERSYTIFLLGAEKEVLNTTVRNLEKHYPNIRIVGYHDGYFNMADKEESAYIVERIRTLSPDFIFVGLGVPRQENWVADHYHHFDRGVFLCVGGSFDVLAGVTKRAPISWQNCNLEWLYRLFQQPARWKRMVSLPHFAAHIYKEKVAKRK
ncbi:WecB/TagA/CpsF family glycosyltransferase [Salimicrobium sp. PL1-032A]|uniref:WecB/TagA/CpsF family glycosyltransferase n=1 Tax=Salimicrobium sp. PL1-032A TaxID=3095364 RepID=UPI00326048BC